MKEYASVGAMNADINNIAEGEVVKVVAVSEGEPVFYLKETTMKKLIKEEDAPVSPEEYEEDLILADDILNNGPETMEALNDVMGTQDEYEGLGGTEEEIMEVFEDILGETSNNEINL